MTLIVREAQVAQRTPAIKRLIGAVFCSAVVLVSSARASSDGVLPVAASVDQNRMMAWDVTRDGAHLAYVVNKTNLADRLPSPGVNWTERGVYLYGIHGSKLHVVNIADGTDVRLSNRESTDWNPSWSPDGRYLAFFSDRDGAARLWLWDRLRKQVRRLSSEVVQVDLVNRHWAPIWMQDSSRLVVPLLPVRLSPAELARGNHQAVDADPTVMVYNSPLRGVPYEEPHNEVDLATIEVATGQVHRFHHRAMITSVQVVGPRGDKVFFTQLKGQKSLTTYTWLFDVYQFTTGADRPERILTDVEQLVPGRFLAPSPDGKAVAFFSAWPRAPGREPGFGECYWMRIGDEPTHCVVGVSLPAFYGNRPPTWSRDGHRLFASAANGIFEIDLADNHFRELSAPTASVIGDYTYAARDDGHESIWAIARSETGLASSVVEWDLATGERRASPTISGTIDRLTVRPTTTAEEARLFVERHDVRTPPDIWLSHGSNAEAIRITDSNPHLGRLLLGKSRVVEYSDGQGNRLRAALLLPGGYQPGKLYPLVVTAYPDSRLHRTANRWGMAQALGIDPQLLATRGYAVLAVDTKIGVGSLMRDIVSGVMAGVDHAVQIGVADPDRLAVMGQSFGGYAVFAAITQTDRFRAAVERNGFANVMTNYGQFEEDGNIHYAMAIFEENRSLGGTPWSARDRYLDNSPVWFFDRISTPLLMIHGTADTSVQIQNGDESFALLRRLGKEVEYLRYEDERHGFLLRVNCIDSTERTLEFLDKKLDIVRDEDGRIVWNVNRVLSNNAWAQ